jgi:hypothetical protein
VAPPKDLYSQMVAQAEAGEAVNFLALRMAYLKSPAFAAGRSASDQVLELRKEMFAAMKADDARTVRAKADETLKLVYIDLEAHKARYQSCAALGDQACAARGKLIETGLLQSVVSGGDGRTCSTAWKVVTVDEEYFVMRMLEVELRQQALVDEDGHQCDRMAVTSAGGEERTYYFEVGPMLDAAERALTQPR